MPRRIATRHPAVPDNLVTAPSAVPDTLVAPRAVLALNTSALVVAEVTAVQGINVLAQYFLECALLVLVLPRAKSALVLAKGTAVMVNVLLLWHLYLVPEDAHLLFVMRKVVIAVDLGRATVVRA